MVARRRWLSALAVYHVLLALVVQPLVFPKDSRGGGFFATGEVLLILCGALPTLPTHLDMRLGPMQVHGILKFVARLCHCNQDSCMEHLGFLSGTPFSKNGGGSPVFLLCRGFQE